MSTDTDGLPQVHPRAVDAARALAPHLHAAAHRPSATDADHAAWSDVLATTNAVLAWSDPTGDASGRSADCGHMDPDDYAELFAEMLEEKGQYLAAGYCREVTAKDDDGRARRDPPTSAMNVVPLRP
jgi:hypothetical protein